MGVEKTSCRSCCRSRSRESTMAATRLLDAVSRQNKDDYTKINLWQTFWPGTQIKIGCRPYQHQLAIVAQGNGHELLYTSGNSPYEVSHLCLNARCFSPEHVIVESNVLNRRRKTCCEKKVTWTLDGRIYHPCPHGQKERGRRCILPRESSSEQRYYGPTTADDSISEASFAVVVPVLPPEVAAHYAPLPLSPAPESSLSDFVPSSSASTAETVSQSFHQEQNTPPAVDLLALRGRPGVDYTYPCRRCVLSWRRVDLRQIKSCCRPDSSHTGTCARCTLHHHSCSEVSMIDPG